MINIDYKGYRIKIKRLPQHFEWLILIRDNIKTIAREQWDSKEEGEQWAKNFIENMN